MQSVKRELRDKEGRSEVRRKNKYLYQLLITGAVLIIVPTIFFFTFFLQRSYKEIRNSNAEYYDNLSRTFAGTFVSELSNFRDQAVVFEVSTRENSSEGGIFFEGTDKMAENPYYLWEACRDLQEYEKKSGLEGFGVYYYEQDWVLHEEQKFTSDKLIRYILGEASGKEEAFDCVKKFFDADSYEASKIIFAPVYNKNLDYQKTLVGICARLGKDREKAICFYILKPQSMEFFYQSRQSRPWENYYVLDEFGDQVIFQIGENKEYETLKNADTRKEIYTVENCKSGVSIVLDVSGNTEQNSVYSFYHDMVSYIIYVLLLMILISGLAVYYNYRPIRQLLKKVTTDGKDEFDAIFNSWEMQELGLTEQRAMIMDLLMNHLLYGIHLSDEQVEKLGVSECVTHYCVFLLENHVLLSDETAQITKTIESNFQTILFVTDLYGENATVMIAFMEKDNGSDIMDWLLSWMSRNVLCDEISFYRGKTVSKLDDIRDSLADCQEQSTLDKSAILTARAKEKARSKRVESYELLQEKVLEYLNENFLDQNLTQVKVADHFNVSVYSLSRIFKKQFGMGFSEYVNGKRLEYAKVLLRTTELSVKEVAEASGFGASDYFTRVFKQSMGVTPSKYRTMDE
jgi:AraC-like DNA-binding protein